MTPLATLWLPIVLSAVFLFFASAIIHMVMPWHKSDFARLPDEEAFRRAVAPMRIPPGDYVAPHCLTSADMKSPEYAAKLEEGPVLLMTVRPTGPIRMGPMFLSWMGFLLVASTFVGWIAGAAVPPGAETRYVWHFTAAIAFVIYGLATWPAVIWYGRKASSAFKDSVDGVIYAVITAVTFGWLWPVG